MRVPRSCRDVKALLQSAWERKAPKGLLAAPRVTAQ
jgi:hypothetical protein